MANARHNSGFIALTSAIIIAVLILAITLSLSFAGFFARFNVLDSESKERSFALAEACANNARVEAISGTYSANESISIGPGAADNCTVVSSEADQPVSGETLIKTQAVIN